MKPEKLLGTAEWMGNTVRFRLSKSVDPSRKLHDLRDYIGDRMATDRAEAVDQGKRLAHKMSLEARAKHAARVALASAPKGETVTAWAERWRAWRVKMGRVESDTDDAKNFRCYIEPVIGHLPMRTVGAADIEKIVERLDARIVSEGDDALSWKTARNAWTCLRAMFKDACTAKGSSGLRVRSDNPPINVAPPEKPKKGTGDKLLTFLYPSDFLTLVTAETIWDAKKGQAKRLSANIARAKAAKRWMRIFTLAIYNGLRARELKGWRWEWIDLEHWVGKVEVQANTSRDAKRTGSEDKDPKSGSFREFDFEIEVRPLIKQMYEEAKAASGGKAPTGRIFPTFPTVKDLARRLRQYLMLAGCTRPELHTRNAHRVPLRFHDLRATTGTWMAMRGDNPFHIQEMLGHKSFPTTEKYIRRVRRIRGADWGTPFPPIPACVIGGAAQSRGQRKPNSLETEKRSTLSRGAETHRPEFPVPRGKVASSAHRRNVGTTRPARRRPESGPMDPQVHEIAQNNSVPKGIRSEEARYFQAKLASTRADPARNRPRSPSVAVPPSGTDPVAAALRAALDTAIAEGRSTDAAALAKELAARARATTAENVLNFGERARRRQ